MTNTRNTAPAEKPAPFPRFTEAQNATLDKLWDRYDYMARNQHVDRGAVRDEIRRTMRDFLVANGQVPA